MARMGRPPILFPVWELLTESYRRFDLPTSMPLARELGIEYFYPDKECSNGHRTVRVTAQPKCPECARRRARRLPLRDPHLVEVFGMHVNLDGRELGFRGLLPTY